MNTQKILVIGTSKVDELFFKNLKKQNSDSKISVLIYKKDYISYKKIPIIDDFIFLESTDLTTFKKVRQEIRKHNFDKSFIPKDEGSKFDFIDLKLFGFLKLCGLKKIFYFNKENSKSRLVSSLIFLKGFLSILLLLISPIISFIIVPFTILRNIFSLIINHTKEEFLGYSATGVAGHMIYLAKAKMTKVYGLFGINNRECMGLPITLHRTPLDTLLLRLVNHRFFVLITSLLTTIAFAIGVSFSGHLDMLLLVPFIFFSSFYLNNVVIGHTEFLSWSFLSLSVILYITNFPILSAIFFGLMVLSHTTISIIGFFLIIAIAIPKLLFGSFLANFSVLALYGIIVGVMTIFFIWPFIRTRNKLARNVMINEHYSWKGQWSILTISELLLYSLFILSTFIGSSFNTLQLILFIPLVTLIFNTKFKWIFSQYTVENSMLIVGFIYLIFFPKISSIIVFFYMIFISPKILSKGFKGASYFSYDLNKMKIFGTDTKIKQLFSKVPDNCRVALEEHPRSSRSMLNYYNAFLSGILTGSKFELLNAYGVEFVEPQIYLQFSRHLNENTNIADLKEILIKSGSEYILVYSESFKKKLLNANYTQVGEVNCKPLNYTNQDGPIITLLKAPFTASTVEPKSQLIINQNKIELEAEANKVYSLKYSYYPGWRAYQKGKRITIKDAKPGMIIKSRNNSPITLIYKYKNYWN